MRFYALCLLLGATVVPAVAISAAVAAEHAVTFLGAADDMGYVVAFATAGVVVVLFTKAVARRSNTGP